MMDDRPRPLCVDLDGTLIQTDLLIESVLVLLKRNPFWLFVLPLWLLKGKAHFKQQIAQRVELDVTRLPFNQPLLAYLRDQQNQGRRLVLATAANQRHAEQVALHLGLFAAILASDAEINLSGTRKRDRLVEWFGASGFDYAGNSISDLRVWSHARKAIVVNASAPLARQVAGMAEVEHIIPAPAISLRTYLKALRVHQWVKNALVFVPLLAAHQVFNPALLLQTALAFLAFGLCASSVYVLNDLLDLAADRAHPTKCRRPFAAGLIPIQQGLWLIPSLLTLAFLLALWLPFWLSVTLGLYYLLTLAYSLRLKQWVLIDVLTLAGLYTLRIGAGGAATGIPLSFWLLALSLFLFLSLALAKRYAELQLCYADGRDCAAGRGYRTADLETLAQFGIVSGYLSALVLALYIDSADVMALYTEPSLLWLVCPLLLYWISRVWLLARRGALHEDPVVFALTDPVSYTVFALVAGCVWLASSSLTGLV